MLSYSIIGDDTAPNYFQIGPASGIIQVKSSVLADTTYLYRVGVVQFYLLESCEFFLRWLERNQNFFLSGKAKNHFLGWRVQLNITFEYLFLRYLNAQRFPLSSVFFRNENNLKGAPLALIAQSVELWTLTREARVRLPAVAVSVVVLSKPLMHSCFGPLSRLII